MQTLELFVIVIKLLSGYAPSSIKGSLRKGEGFELQNTIYMLFYVRKIYIKEEKIRRMEVSSLKIAINLPRNYKKLHHKEGPNRTSD